MSENASESHQIRIGFRLVQHEPPPELANAFNESFRSGEPITLFGKNYRVTASKQTHWTSTIVVHEFTLEAVEAERKAAKKK